MVIRVNLSLPTSCKEKWQKNGFVENLILEAEKMDWRTSDWTKNAVLRQKTGVLHPGGRFLAPQGTVFCSVMNRPSQGNERFNEVQRTVRWNTKNVRKSQPTDFLTFAKLAKYEVLREKFFFDAEFSNFKRGRCRHFSESSLPCVFLYFFGKRMGFIPFPNNLFWTIVWRFGWKLVSL